MPEIKVTKYFITGGAGFIGSHLVDRLMKEGKQVTVYDNLVSGRKQNTTIGSLAEKIVRLSSKDAKIKMTQQNRWGLYPERQTLARPGLGWAGSHG